MCIKCQNQVENSLNWKIFDGTDLKIFLYVEDDLWLFYREILYSPSILGFAQLLSKTLLSDVWLKTRKCFENLLKNISS